MMTRIAYENWRIISSEVALTVERAQQILETYASQGYTMTLRQLYYQFVARGWLENNLTSYKNLGAYMKRARMAGMVSWTQIEDEGRNCRRWIFTEDESEVLDGIEYVLHLDRWARQDTYMEVWVEKQALENVVSRACTPYLVPYMACRGYLSASEAWRAGLRFQQMSRAGKRCIIFHLGDHDPSGIDMTRDNDDRVYTLSFGADVEVKRLALNMDQVEEYSPPPNPAKVTDSRSRDYIARYGHESWELDALEPQVINDLIVENIRAHIDEEAWRETEESEAEKRERLIKLSENWDEISRYIDERY